MLFCKVGTTEHLLLADIILILRTVDKLSISMIRHLNTINKSFDKKDVPKLLRLSTVHFRIWCVGILNKIIT